MTKYVTDFVLIFLLVILAFSPAIMLNLFDKYVMNKKNVNVFDRDIFNEPLDVEVGEGESWFNLPMRVERDESVLKNLAKMVEQTTNPHVKQMWNIKKMQFERQLRWYSIMDRSNGNETLPVT